MTVPAQLSKLDPWPMPKAHDRAQLKATGPIPKAHARAQLNLSLATFKFQLETVSTTVTCSAEPCTDAEGS